MSAPVSVFVGCGVAEDEVELDVEVDFRAPFFGLDSRLCALLTMYLRLTLVGAIFVGVIFADASTSVVTVVWTVVVVADTATEELELTDGDELLLLLLLLLEELAGRRELDAADEEEEDGAALTSAIAVASTVRK